MHQASVIVASLLEDDLPGGVAPDNHRWGHLNQEQLAIGKKVEMEHTNDPGVAEEIAADHLTEDPEYYRKLKAAGLAESCLCTCDKCGARFDYCKEPEAGMGYVACPTCKEPVTQEQCDPKD